MAGPADLAPLPAGQGSGPGTGIELLGRRLRAARVQRALGVRELARQVGCSASLVSQIERGRATPSVATLVALSTTLEVSLDELLDPDEPSLPAPGAALSAPAPDPEHRLGVVLRRAQRHPVEPTRPVRRQMLTPLPEEGAEFVEVVFAPGADSSTDDRPSRHAGREYALVLEGTLEVRIGRLRHRLGPGDSFAFDARVPHRFANPGPTAVRAVWFVTDRAPLGVRRRRGAGRDPAAGRP